MFKYFSFVLIQKKQKIKARDATLVSPFPHLLSLCFVGDLSASSKKTMRSSVWKPEHPSTRERVLLVQPFNTSDVTDYSGTAPITNVRMFWFQQFIFFMSDCFTSKRDELRLGQDLTEGNERKVTMKKPKDH